MNRTAELHPSGAPVINGRQVTPTGIPCPKCEAEAFRTSAGSTPRLSLIDGEDTPFCHGHGYLEICVHCATPFVPTLDTICLRHPTTGAFAGFVCTDACEDTHGGPQ